MQLKTVLYDEEKHAVTVTVAIDGQKALTQDQRSVIEEMVRHSYGEDVIVTVETKK